ncbi:MAG: hypothetical protein FWG72_08100 [Oscillospiraceae bacterium]|nr:hypothetical protein [Oscillospiraceae bacterium]
MRIHEEKDGSHKKWLVTITILAVNLALTVGVIVYLLAGTGGRPADGGSLNFESDERVQYVLYIGTNDKDTYEQMIPTEEAVEIVNAIIARHAGGYTMQYSVGGWVDERDLWTHENTLVYTLSWIEEEAVRAIMDEVLAALNQNSILVEKSTVLSVFYSGEERHE